jgi:hypothetical protein
MVRINAKQRAESGEQRAESREQSEGTYLVRRSKGRWENARVNEGHTQEQDSIEQEHENTYSNIKRKGKRAERNTFDEQQETKDTSINTMTLRKHLSTTIMLKPS